MHGVWVLLFIFFQLMQDSAGTTGQDYVYKIDTQGLAQEGLRNEMTHA